MIEIAQSLKDYRIRNGLIVGKLPRSPFRVVLTASLLTGDGKQDIQYQDVSHSFVKNFVIWLYNSFAVLSATATTQSNTSVAPTGILQMAFGAGAAGTNNGGLQVGTGTTSPAPTDYFLQTAIGHGSGTGQLQYGAVNFTAPSVSGQVTSFTIWRTFTNASGGTIGVTEAILGGKDTVSGGVFCVARDIFTVINVLNTKVLTETYTISVTT